MAENKKDNAKDYNLGGMPADWPIANYITKHVAEWESARNAASATASMLPSNVLDLTPEIKAKAKEYVSIAEKYVQEMDAAYDAIMEKIKKLFSPSKVDIDKGSETAKMLRNIDCRMKILLISETD